MQYIKSNNCTMFCCCSPRGPSVLHTRTMGGKDSTEIKTHILFFSKLKGNIVLGEESEQLSKVIFRPQWCRSQRQNGKGNRLFLILTSYL